jgi:hypothetical protein
MSIFQVAIVSQTERVLLEQVTLVSAAIQKQVTSDFQKYWDVKASVDAFGKLADVPLGYWPIIIMDKIDAPAAGYHKDKNGQPFSLVRFSPNWSLTTSHECLEMLADPFAHRVIAGDSVKPGQGRVEYLVEVCDPSEAAQFGYSINGILVSDFYTPAFFDPIASSGVRYSFTGAITEPRQVLDGGYLSWFDPVTAHLFQLLVTDGEKTFIDRGLFPGGFEGLRSFSDRYSADHRLRAMEETPPPSALLLTGALSATPSAENALFDKAVSANADALQRQIDAIVSGQV